MKHLVEISLTGAAPESESITLDGFLAGDTTTGSVLDETGTVCGYWEMSS